MPHYLVTGMHSHRHPFYGYGAAPAPALDLKSVMSPMWAGLIMGLASYSLAGAMGIDKRKAAGLGLALGATIAIGQIGSAWLQGYLDKAKVQAPASASATAPAVPATTPIVPPSTTPVLGW